MGRPYPERAVGGKQKCTPSSHLGRPECLPSVPELANWIVSYLPEWSACRRRSPGPDHGPVCPPNPTACIAPSERSSSRGVPRARSSSRKGPPPTTLSFCSGRLSTSIISPHDLRFVPVQPVFLSIPTCFADRERRDLTDQDRGARKRCHLDPLRRSGRVERNGIDAHF